MKLFHTGKKWFLAEYSPMDTVYLSIVEKLRKISWPTLIRRDNNIRPPKCQWTLSSIDKCRQTGQCFNIPCVSGYPATEWVTVSISDLLWKIIFIVSKRFIFFCLLYFFVYNLQRTKIKWFEETFDPENCWSFPPFLSF